MMLVTNKSLQYRLYTLPKLEKLAMEFTYNIHVSCIIKMCMPFVVYILVQYQFCYWKNFYFAGLIWLWHFSLSKGKLLCNHCNYDNIRSNISQIPSGNLLQTLSQLEQNNFIDANHTYMGKMTFPEFSYVTMKAFESH